METHREEGFWKRVNRSVKRVLEEMKEDSVANHPRKPVDCCNPPVPPRTEKSSKT